MSDHDALVGGETKADGPLESGLKKLALDNVISKVVSYMREGKGGSETISLQLADLRQLMLAWTDAKEIVAEQITADRGEVDAMSFLADGVPASNYKGPVADYHRKRVRTAAEDVEKAVSHVGREGLIQDDSPCVDLIFLDKLKRKAEELDSASSHLPTVLHAVAVKANPLHHVLAFLSNLNLGAECASMNEVNAALAAGFPPEKIVYDSPCKSSKDIEEAIRKGLYINLDNRHQIALTQKILQAMGAKTAPLGPNITAQFGLRLNPVSVSGETGLQATSTAHLRSKFGTVLLPENEESLIELFQATPWLRGIHCHCGSQVVAPEASIEGIKRVCAFATKVNKRVGYKQISTIDIGGGLPISYDPLVHVMNFEEYFTALRKAVPELSESCEYNIITEFGRAIFTQCGCTVARIESINEDPAPKGLPLRTAVIPVGGNNFIRETFLPDIWCHVISIFDAKGYAKGVGDNDEWGVYNVAGPLCFSGDLVGRQRLFPSAERGDLMVIHDTGGYTMSMATKYCSISSQPVYACWEEKGAVATKLIRRKETTAEILQWWGTPEEVIEREEESAK